MSDLDEEELKATRELKEINKIISPEEKTADEMFKKLGFEKVIDNKKEVKYQYKNTIMGDKIEHTIQIAKIGKIIFSYRDDANHQVMGFSKEELKAINKKIEELG